MERFSDKSFDIYRLDWDTDYFGIDSAKVVLKRSVSEDKRKKLKRYFNQFQFITISNLNNNPYNNIWLGRETTAFLCDMNIQFSKNINVNLPHKREIGEVIEACPYEEAIVEIAKNGFSYSRFFNDPLLNKNKARNIYVHWVNSAFNKPNKYFIIIRRNGIIVGFLLFSINEENSFSTIELIAVDEDYRGQNIGKALISTMEKFLKDKKITKIKVGTQVDNRKALIFYINNGFVFNSCNSIYHYWPKVGLRK